VGGFEGLWLAWAAWWNLVDELVKILTRAFARDHEPRVEAVPTNYKGRDFHS